MLVEVTKNKVKILECEAINQGEYNINKCSFNLPECFKGLTVCACFNNIPVPLVDGECVIPSLEQGTAVMGVYAYKENEGSLELMYSPEPAMFCVLKGSFSGEVNKEAVPEISVYEQYCKMIKSEYEELQRSAADAELLRGKAEDNRKTVFLANELERQSVFENNEKIRNAVANGVYTNLLENIAEENSTTANPTQFPAHKTDVIYEQTWAYNLESSTGYECYIFEAKQGDRFNLSGYNIASASGKVSCVAIVDSEFSVIDNFNTALKATKFCIGIYACPENTAYVILNKAIDGYTPVVTGVAEPVFETSGGFVPSGTKCASPLYNNIYHAAYEGSVNSLLTNGWKTEAYTRYSNGIYPLEEGVEYVLYVPESIEYAGLGYICNSDFTVNTIINDGNLDDNRRYVFTATENDKYIALNCYDFATIQFGKNRSSKVQMGANIGNAFYDGTNNISLADMGVIDRKLPNKKWVSYGDSITAGVGVDYVNGERLWQHYVAERYNLNHIKMGVGFSSVAYKSTNTEKAFCNDDRLTALIAEEPDIVTILGGANDYRFNIPIGTDQDVRDKNIETFKGAYAYILDKILTAKPDTTIILLGMFLNTVGHYSEGKGTYPLKDYADATREIAEYFGLPFVDLNECGFNSHNFNTTDGVFSTDGIHPNAEGTKRIAMVVSRWFDTFKGTIY